MKVKKLLRYLSTGKPDDELVMETIDLVTGDTHDLYPFYVDSVKVNEYHNEIRICQMRNDHIECWIEQKQTTPLEEPK